jgi:uncharacterized protein
MTTAHAPSPADPTARIGLVDSLRGFALFGVCLANLFTGFSFVGGPTPAPQPHYTLATDGAASFLMHALVEGKFYSIFSLLFGLGFALQLQRAEARGGDGLSLYMRRLRILMLIGLLHILLLWAGDILLFYGLMGLILVRLRQLDERTAIRWAAICILLPIPFYLPTLIHPLISLGTPPNVVLFGLSKLLGFDIEDPNLVYNVFIGRDAGRWLGLELLGLFYRFGDLLFTGRPFKVLAMFLLGMLIGRRELWARLDESAAMLRRVALSGLGVGLPASLLWATIKDPASYYAGTLQGLTETVLYALAVAPLALAYAALFALGWRLPALRRILGVLAPAGRMALTNYLTQTVVAILIFSGWGLGLAGRVGATYLWPLAAATLAAQIIVSAWWLRRFRFGPMEWVWRSLTYRSWQPMRTPVVGGHPGPLLG